MAEKQGPARILVVEDNASIADIIRRGLHQGGMEPVVCSSGSLAKVLLDRDTFDAVLLDIMMPDVDGYEVLRHIRSSPALDELPVVMLTAKAGRDDVERALAMGANAYITKPFGPHNLLRTLRDLLAKHAGAASDPTAP
jgi:DNA-binding response OmpR family regulator